MTGFEWACSDRLRTALLVSSASIMLLLSGCGRAEIPAPDPAGPDALGPGAEQATPPLAEGTLQFDLLALQKQAGDTEAAIRAAGTGRASEALLQRRKEIEAKIRQLQNQMQESVGSVR
jgi:hypothetical protein